MTPNNDNGDLTFCNEFFDPDNTGDTSICLTCKLGYILADKCIPYAIDGCKYYMDDKCVQSKARMGIDFSIIYR